MSYEELKNKLHEEVKKLQMKCNHPETYWAVQWWAIGHRTGNAVKVCKICNKTLEVISLSKAYGKGYLKEWK